MSAVKGPDIGAVLGEAFSVKVICPLWALRRREGKAAGGISHGGERTEQMWRDGDVGGRDRRAWIVGRTQTLPVTECPL